jgi:hypothetical protein
MGLGGDASTSTGARWLLRVLYAILIVSAAALVTALLGNLVPASNESLRHLFVFDLAWAVFLFGSLATLGAGAGALIAGWLRRSPGLKPYAMWALGYAVIAVAAFFVAGGNLEL